MTIKEMDTGSSNFTVEGALHPQVFHPWRRFLARTLDLFLYTILWSAVLAFLFHVNLTTRSGLGDILDAFVAMALMLVLEPLWLHVCATTPGKAIFGLRVETFGGRRLTVGEGWARTWGVIGAGMGYSLPIYNLYRLWKSYRLCKEREPQPWDESIAYTIKDTKRYRGVVYAGAYACGFIVVLAMVSAQQIPPHRGNLTVAEYVQNYNYYAQLLGIGFGDEYLDDTGKWIEKKFDGTAYIETTYTKKPDFSFTMENGSVTGVSFAVELKNNHEWLSSYNTHMLLACLAFAGAQNEFGLFSQIPNRIAEQIRQNTFHDFHFSAAGIAFASETEYSGYKEAQPNLLLPDEEASETYFRLNFAMSK